MLQHPAIKNRSDLKQKMPAGPKSLSMVELLVNEMDHVSSIAKDRTSTSPESLKDLDLVGSLSSVASGRLYGSGILEGFG